MGYVTYSRRYLGEVHGGTEFLNFFFNDFKYLAIVSIFLLEKISSHIYKGEPLYAIGD